MSNNRLNYYQIMISRLWELHATKIKFIVVGIWNAIFGYMVYFGLYHFFKHIFLHKYEAYLSALILSNLLAITNAYIFHKYITFRSPVRGLKMIPEYLRFFSTYILSIIMSLVLLPFLIEVFNIDPSIAGAVIIVFCAFTSYIGHSRFSFKLE